MGHSRGMPFLRPLKSNWNFWGSLNTNLVSRGFCFVPFVTETRGCSNKKLTYREGRAGEPRPAWFGGRPRVVRQLASGVAPPACVGRPPPSALTWGPGAGGLSSPPGAPVWARSLFPCGFSFIFWDHECFQLKISAPLAFFLFLKRIFRKMLAKFKFSNKRLSPPDHHVPLTTSPAIPPPRG